jgi:filamentous hemagglutinin family protein
LFQWRRGGATITPAPNDLNVDLNNSNRIVEWDSFNVANGDTLAFVSGDAVTPFSVLNRVVMATQSNIDGTIVSQNNISVWLINPAGIVFGSEGNFSGGSLVLSTLDSTPHIQTRSSLPVLGQFGFRVIQRMPYRWWLAGAKLPRLMGPSLRSARISS